MWNFFENTNYDESLYDMLHCEINGILKISKIKNNENFNNYNETLGKENLHKNI